MRDLLHRNFWARLPREKRRAALFRVASLLAPRLDPQALAKQPIIVAGALRSASGLGQSARLCYRALAATGFDVAAVDLTRGLMQRVDLPDFQFRDGTKHQGEGTLIAHVNAPFMSLAAFLLGRRLTRGKRVVGYWAWELPQVPAEWLQGLDFVHDIWVPSRFAAEAVRPISQGRDVYILPHPIGVDAAAPVRRGGPSGSAFNVLTFCNAASSVARKNPLAAVTAFRRAFGDGCDARLVVKGSNLNAHPQVRESVGPCAPVHTYLIRCGGRLQTICMHLASVPPDEAATWGRDA